LCEVHVSAGTTVVYRAALNGTYRRDLNVVRHQTRMTEQPSSANHDCCASVAFLCSWIFVIATGALFAKWYWY